MAISVWEVYKSAYLRSSVLIGSGKSEHNKDQHNIRGKMKQHNNTHRLGNTGRYEHFIDDVGRKRL